MKSIVRTTMFAAGLGCALLLAATAAQAQAPAEIAQRQELMKANGAAMRTLTPIVRGEAPWNAATAGAAAASIVAGAEKNKSLFPAGSMGTSAALPAIWERKAEFDGLFDRQRDAAATLVRLAAAGDEAGFKAAFPALGQSCGACHTPFRKPAN
jgi:cytochrome c556